MTANLRVVFEQNESNVMAHSDVLALVPRRTGRSHSEIGMKFSARLVLVVIAVHVLSIAWILLNKPEQVLMPQVQMPMMVSLLQMPVTANREVMKTLPPKPLVKKQPLSQKREVQKPTVKESLPLTSAPAKEVVLQEPVAKEQVPVDVAEVSKFIETLEVAKNVARSQESLTKKADLEPELESQVEPPKFGAAYLNNPAPEYPALARRKGEQGRVLLKVLVSETGMAEKVQVDTSSGFGKLDQAAVEAVKKWSFIPARRSNQPVSAYVLVPIKFSLNS